MITTDVDYYPLVTTRWSGDITLPEFEEHSRVLKAIAARAVSENIQIVLVVDTKDQRTIEARVRKAMSAEAKSVPPGLFGTWVSLSAAAKLILTALKWVGTKGLDRVYPCTSLQQAHAGAISALDELGLTVPPRARLLVQSPAA